MLALIGVPQDGMEGSLCPTLSPTPSLIPHGMEKGLGCCGGQCFGLEVLATSQRGAVDGSETWWEGVPHPGQDDQQDRTPLRKD